MKIPNRVNFNVVYHENQKEVKANIQGVKTYGRVWGAILLAFGYASKTDTGIYVNRRSFFQHLVEAWCQTHGKEHHLKDRVAINEMARNIETDKGLDPSFLTQEKVEFIFKNCQNQYITVSIMGEKINGKDYFKYKDYFK